LGAAGTGRGGGVCVEGCAAAGGAEEFVAGVQGDDVQGLDYEGEVADGG